MSVKINESSQLNLATQLDQVGKSPKLEQVDLLENSATSQSVNPKAVAQVKQTEIANQEDSAEVAAKTKEITALDEEKIANAMRTISEFISMPIRTVNFVEDDGSDKTVIKIFDSESKELIRQFPSEEILMIAQRIVELQQDVGKKTGILLDESI